MSIERDELAKVIYTSHRGNTQVDLLDNRRLQGSQLAWARLAADTLIAAGWRKSRTITKLHELAGVSNGAVLMDSLNQVWLKLAPSKYESTSGLVCLEPTLLPATVLHEPEAAL